MAERLRLTVACGDYEIVRALKEGTVKADGLDLVMLTGMGPRERHWRMARKAEFDVCEANVGAYFMERDHGIPLTAIPVFLHRRFRHGFLFVNAAAGFREPKDLIGKKVGGTNFQPASNIWMRGILEEEYGLPHRQVTWMVERSEDVAFTPPKDLRIEMIPSGKQLDVMLAEGEIPAMLSPELPPLFLKGDKRIVRLFPNYKDVELGYFRRTGIFPIMHVMVVRDEVLERDPWVATALVKAFQQAKEACYRYIRDQRKSSLAWFGAQWEEEQALLGPDPWPYTFAENQHTLETLLQYAHEQGLIPERWAPETLFAPSTIRYDPTAEKTIWADR
jgi:4,5-dihydroxyphthalate decarboxylase